MTTPEGPEPPQDWFFTFGMGHTRAGKYVRIHGTFGSAREAMFERFGPRWAMQYPTAEDAGVERWGLTELDPSEVAGPAAERLRCHAFGCGAECVDVGISPDAPQDPNYFCEEHHAEMDAPGYVREPWRTELSDSQIAGMLLSRPYISDT